MIEHEKVKDWTWRRRRTARTVRGSCDEPWPCPTRGCVSWSTELLRCAGTCGRWSRTAASSLATWSRRRSWDAARMMDHFLVHSQVDEREMEQ